MTKQILLLMLVAAALLSLWGCSSIYQKEILTLTDYNDEAHQSLLGEAPEITNYTELKGAIIAMVNNHETEQKLKITGYSDNMQSELSQACWEVRAENPLAGYAVEQMSSYPVRIVNYYEATVYITYRHTAAEIANIQYINSPSKLEDAIDPKLDSMQKSFAIRLFSNSITEEEILAAISNAYVKNPLSCVVEPTAEVNIYPEVGQQRILEIKLSYDRPITELKKLKTSLSDKIDEIVQRAGEGSDTSRALALFQAIADHSIYQPQEGTPAVAPSVSPQNLSSTAYGALVDGSGDSRGFALAYSALCRKAGIECLVVGGNMDKLPHWWNIINIDDVYFHVDVSAAKTTGVGGSFLLSDSQMPRLYWWNIENYPPCDLQSNAAQATA